ncbi:hypothetical protein RB195_000833 [Necator americanus]|uniref:Uncharacterized protein n=1 Tax=Necator americanus TaxID=51031 RepID=A0ABR1DBJ9_NECAM
MLPLSILFAFGSLGNDVIYCPQNGGKAKENAVVKPLLAQIKNSRLLLLRNRQRNLPDGYPMPMPKSMGVVFKNLYHNPATDVFPANIMELMEVYVVLADANIFP